MTSMPACVLTIAGTDPGGGAGIQADLKTFHALGTYGMSVIAALTVQNTHGVLAIQDIAPAFVRAQLEAVLRDIGNSTVSGGDVHAVAAERWDWFAPDELPGALLNYARRWLADAAEPAHATFVQ